MAIAVGVLVMRGQRIGAGVGGAEHRVLDRDARVVRAEQHRAAGRRGRRARPAPARSSPSSSRHASRANRSDMAVRRVVTYDSTACESASKPAMAVTAARLRDGERRDRESRRGTRPCGSPHAIFTCVSASEMSAYDCASLPVPAVVGTPIDGSIGSRRLAEALVVAHRAAVGQHEVDALGAVQRAAAAERDERVDRAARPRARGPPRPSRVSGLASKS